MNSDSLLCTGDGYCIQQVHSDTTYIKYNTISCMHSCEPKQCANYMYCKQLMPQWVLSANGGVCLECLHVFGNIRITEEKNCSFCSKRTFFLQHPTSSHDACVSCYIDGYFSYAKYAPEFPYPEEIEDKYDNDPSSFDDDPLIQKYLDAIDEWQEDRRYSAYQQLAPKRPTC